MAGRRRSSPGLACLALAATIGAVGRYVLGVELCSLTFVAPGPSSRRHAAVGRQAGGAEFNYGKAKGGGGFGAGSGGGKAKRKRTDGDSASESAGLAKREREGTSKQLTTTKLKDLRDKTLALRQKREAELDDYEEGRAMIAKYGPEVGVMPARVAQRAAKRGMVIGGSFYATMLAVFGVAFALYKITDIIIPPTLVAFITLFLLGLAVIGGTYGLMSASWDEGKEGSLLGVEEFGDNVKYIGDGFRKASMQEEYDKALELRKERRALQAAKAEKKKEIANKKSSKLLEG